MKGRTKVLVFFMIWLGLAGLQTGGGLCPAAYAAENWLTITMPGDPGGQKHLLLIQNGAMLEVHDEDTGAVLVSALIATLYGVRVQGADADHDDTLTIDFSGGMFGFPGGISFEGGAGGNDTLVLRGGSATQESVNMTGAGAGTIAVDGLQIVFTGLEPISDTVSAVNYIYNAPASGIASINIADGPVIGGFQTTQISATGLETVNIANKTNVTVNSGASSTAITINNPNPGVGLSALTVNGEDGDDIFYITPGSVPIAINGGDPAPPVLPGDVLNVYLTGTTGAALSVTSNASGYHGSLTFGNRQAVQFSAIEMLVPIPKLEQAITFNALSDRVYGESFTVSATGGGSSSPVTFSISNGPATATGTNGSTITINGVGSVTVRASQGGDAYYSDAPDVDQTFNATQAATTTAITSNVPNPSAYGQSVTLTAAVSAVAPGSGTPTGSVTFKDGGAIIGTAALSGGVATLTISTLSVGSSHSLTAEYGGDTNFLISASSSVTQTVNQAATSAGVLSSPNPLTYGQAVIFTATVSALAPASGTPTGTVTFKDGTITLGTGTLSGGTATFSTSTLATGGHTITAVYSGDTNFTGSTSSALTQNVNQAATAVPTMTEWGMIVFALLAGISSAYYLRRRRTPQA